MEIDEGVQWKSPLIWLKKEKRRKWRDMDMNGAHHPNKESHVSQ